MLVQDYLASVHVSQHKVEHLVVLAVLHLYDLLHRLVNLEHRVESARAGGQHTSVSWEVPPTYLKKIMVSFAYHHLHIVLPSPVTEERTSSLSSIYQFTDKFVYLQNDITESSLLPL